MIAASFATYVVASFLVVGIWIAACEGYRWQVRRTTPTAMPVTTYCTGCDRSVKNFAEHVAAEHPDIARVFCGYCSKVVPPDVWDSHQRLWHDDARPQGVEDRPDWMGAKP